MMSPEQESLLAQIKDDAESIELLNINANKLQDLIEYIQTSVSTDGTNPKELTVTVYSKDGLRFSIDGNDISDEVIMSNLIPLFEKQIMSIYHEIQVHQLSIQLNSIMLEEGYPVAKEIAENLGNIEQYFKQKLNDFKGE